MTAELTAAGIREQIARLEDLLKDLQTEPPAPKAFVARLLDVENRIAKLRRGLIHAEGGLPRGVNFWLS